jgi:hypothetical protein
MQLKRLFYARGKYVTLADGGGCNFLKTCLKISAKEWSEAIWQSAY